MQTKLGVDSRAQAPLPDGDIAPVRAPQVEGVSPGTGLPVKYRRTTGASPISSFDSVNQAASALTIR
jgi:hypothetical protein